MFIINREAREIKYLVASVRPFVVCVFINRLLIIKFGRLSVIGFGLFLVSTFNKSFYWVCWSEREREREKKKRVPISDLILLVNKIHVLTYGP